MATLLSSKRSDSGSPYVYYEVTATYSKRTEKSVCITVEIDSHLAESVSFLGTGKGLKGYVYIGGEWHYCTIKSTSSAWSGRTKHTVKWSFYVYGLTAMQTSLTGIKFKVERTDSTGSAGELSSRSCNSLSISKGNSSYSNVTIEATADSQAKLIATVSGLPKAVGYTRVICWYRGSTLIGTTSISSTSTVTSFSKAFTGLVPNTTYTLKAVIREKSSTGTAITTKSVNATTSQETGAISLTAGGTYLSVSISGMYSAPNYSRTINVYYKKSSGSSYVLAKSIKENKASTAAATIGGLVSNMKYDVKVTIQNGSTVLKTLTGTKTTVADTGLIPMPFIDDIRQQLGTRKCNLSWLVDKEVSGTAYKIQASTDGTTWEDLQTLTDVVSPCTVVSPTGNSNVSFRVAASNNALVSGKVNYSDVFTIYVRDDFVWDSAKIAGEPLLITANEWNRLGEYATARNEDLGIYVSLTKVAAGEPVTAEIYNEMKNVISNISIISIDDKNPGDVIKAADIDALRAAVNTLIA